MTCIPKQKRKKWDAKSKPLVFVGYASDSKGYRLIDPETRSLVISRDIIIVSKDNYNQHDMIVSFENDISSSKSKVVSLGDRQEMSSDIDSMGADSTNSLNNTLTNPPVDSI